MKKTIRNLIFGLFLLIAFNMNAADELDLKINEQKNLIVELQKIEEGAVISLVDTKGVILFKDRFLNEDSYKKTFSLSRLNDGTYLLKLDKRYSVSTSVIYKKGSELSIDVNAYEFVFKPSFEINGDLVKFFIANPAEKQIKVQILDQNEVLVGSLKSRELVLKRTFDFSEVSSGEYFVEVRVGEDVFMEKLILD